MVGFSVSGSFVGSGSDLVALPNWFKLSVNGAIFHRENNRYYDEVLAKPIITELSHKSRYKVYNFMRFYALLSYRLPVSLDCCYLIKQYLLPILWRKRLLIYPLPNIKYRHNETNIRFLECLEMCDNEEELAETGFDSSDLLELSIVKENPKILYLTGMDSKYKWRFRDRSTYYNPANNSIIRWDSYTYYYEDESLNIYDAEGLLIFKLKWVMIPKCIVDYIMYSYYERDYYRLKNAGKPTSMLNPSDTEILFYIQQKLKVDPIGNSSLTRTEYIDLNKNMGARSLGDIKNEEFYYWVGTDADNNVWRKYDTNNITYEISNPNYGEGLYRFHITYSNKKFQVERSN